MQTSYPCALLVFAGSTRASAWRCLWRRLVSRMLRTGGEGTRGSARPGLVTVGAQIRRKATACHCLPLSAAPVTRQCPETASGPLTLGSLESVAATVLPGSQMASCVAHPALALGLPASWQESLSSPLLSPHLHLPPEGCQQLPNPCPFPQG